MPVSTISGGPINGPWDMTWRESRRHAALFVTNVLNGTVAANGATVHRGTVVRIGLSLTGTQPRVAGERVIGSGFPTHSDPAALVVGPTGLGLSGRGTLYVADSASNRIAAIPHALTRMGSAGMGMTVSRGGLLSDPLGLTVAPNGDRRDDAGRPPDRDTLPRPVGDAAGQRRPLRPRRRAARPRRVLRRRRHEHPQPPALTLPEAPSAPVVRGRRGRHQSSLAQRKPVASGRGGSGLAGSSLVGSSSL
jgi:hypothetical protein